MEKRLMIFPGLKTFPVVRLSLAASLVLAASICGTVALSQPEPSGASSATARPVFRLDGGDTTYAFGVNERGELQHALERMRQKLSETTITKNYLDTVLNSLSDSVLVTTPDGLIKSCNEATERLLGYAESDLTGRPLIDFIDEVHRNAFDLSSSAPEARETVLRTASGQTIPVSMAASTITTPDPQFQGNIYVARNITERKRAERRIRYLARYDTLTKMPNRMQFQHLLQQAIARSRRNQRSLALLYLDLDRFKEVNDTFGH